MGWVLAIGGVRTSGGMWSVVWAACTPVGVPRRRGRAVVADGTADAAGLATVWSTVAFAP